MIFSYGFLEASVKTARELFLDLSIPEDDPLKFVKETVANSAPGVRIFEVEPLARSNDQEHGTGWESGYVWWSCVNEEDGLEFRILQKTSGERELAVIWKGTHLEDPDLIDQRLKDDEMSDVFELRAVVMIQERIQAQLLKLAESTPSTPAEDPQIRPEVRELASRLKHLEAELLEEAYGDLETRKLKLAKSSVVQGYLTAQASDYATAGEDLGDDEEMEDFS